jgi:Protein of unknown function (DUF3685)
MCRFALMGVVNGTHLVSRSMFVRRTHELNALKGWRATLSTCMEIGDVVAPLFTGLADKLSRVVSWLLVALIGRGLGLIYKGVRQSMAGKSTPRARKGGSSRSSASSARQGPEGGDSFFLGFA